MLVFTYRVLYTADMFSFYTRLPVPVLPDVTASPQIIAGTIAAVVPVATAQPIVALIAPKLASSSPFPL